MFTNDASPRAQLSAPDKEIYDRLIVMVPDSLNGVSKDVVVAELLSRLDGDRAAIEDAVVKWHSGELVLEGDWNFGPLAKPKAMAKDPREVVQQLKPVSPATTASGGPATHVQTMM